MKETLARKENNGTNSWVNVTWMDDQREVTW